MLESINTVLQKWFGAEKNQDDSQAVETRVALPREENNPQVHAEHADAVVPYDEHLLERARTQWQFGDWASLSKIESEAIQHHPDRAKLALLAAAGRIHSPAPEDAMRFIRLAQDWGCSKKLIAQIMSAGVHNSLGRAAAIVGRQEQAMKHFNQSIKTGQPGVEARLVGKVRALEQLQQLGKINTNKMTAPGPLQLSSQGDDSLVSDLREIKTVCSSLHQHITDLAARLKQQEDESARQYKAIETTIRSEISNAAKQVESFIGLHRYFDSGELPALNPERHTWPISPDFGLYLIALLETRDYDLVIEFGSGVSTVLTAKAVGIMAARASNEKNTEFVSFEHLEQFYNETSARLAQARVDSHARLIHAPLKEFAARERIFPYYDCHDTLADLARRHNGPASRILVMVDGPPGATAKNARYPAGPLMLKHFPNATIDLLLDDYIREDEKEIARMWQADLSAAGIHYTKTESKLEKDACLLTIQPVSRDAL